MKKYFILAFLLLFLYPVLASEQGNSECIKMNCLPGHYRIWVEKPGKTFDPGQLMEVDMRLVPEQRVQAKEIHMVISFYGIEIMHQVRDHWKIVEAGGISDGIHKVTIPFYSPPGDYTLESWMGFENGEESPHDREFVSVTLSGLFIGLAVIGVIIVLTLLFLIVRNLLPSAEPEVVKPKGKKKK